LGAFVEFFLLCDLLPFVTDGVMGDSTTFLATQILSYLIPSISSTSSLISFLTLSVLNLESFVELKKNNI